MDAKKTSMVDKTEKRVRVPLHQVRVPNAEYNFDLTSPSRSRTQFRAVDGVVFDVYDAAVLTSGAMGAVVRRKAAGIPVDAIKDLPHAHSEILETVLQYCYFHASTARAAMSDEQADEWDEEYSTVDPRQLCELASAAYYLDVRDLVDLTCRAIAGLISGKNPDEIRTTFCIENDLDGDFLGVLPPEWYAPGAARGNKLRTRLLAVERHARKLNRARAVKIQEPSVCTDPDAPEMANASVDEIADWIERGSAKNNGKRKRGRKKNKSPQNGTSGPTAVSAASGAAKTESSAALAVSSAASVVSYAAMASGLGIGTGTGTGTGTETGTGTGTGAGAGIGTENVFGKIGPDGVGAATGADMKGGDAKRSATNSNVKGKNVKDISLDDVNAAPSKGVLGSGNRTESSDGDDNDAGEMSVGDAVGASVRESVNNHVSAEDEESSGVGSSRSGMTKSASKRARQRTSAKKLTAAPAGTKGGDAFDEEALHHMDEEVEAFARRLCLEETTSGRSNPASGAADPVAPFVIPKGKSIPSNSGSDEDLRMELERRRREMQERANEIDAQVAVLAAERERVRDSLALVGMELAKLNRTR